MSETFVTVAEAGEILGVGDTKTRRLLGEPDDVRFQHNKGRCSYLYRLSRVLEVKKQYEQCKCLRCENLGKRCCYHCRQRFKPEELTSGICPSCQAAKILKNFACCGNCAVCPVSCERLQILQKQLTALIQQSSSPCKG